MIILLSGKQGSGKTTLAKALLKKINSNPETYAHHHTFADAIYQMHDFCWGLLKDHGFSMPFIKDGYLLQMLGTEWGRTKIDKDIWIKILKSKITKAAAMSPKGFKHYHIVSDCRFKNEIEAFPNAITVRLDCDEDIRRERVAMWRANTDHISEIDLDYTSFHLNFNSGGISSEVIANEIMKYASSL